jgi:type IX secretion system PorP/SprF family membrane protein
MKKYLLLCFLLFASLSSSFAQQIPLFTQYLSNPYLAFPAVAGMRQETAIKLTTRLSSLGVQGAPQSVFFALATCLNQGDTYFKHGLGLTVMGDKAGLLGKTHLNAVYSFHLPLNPERGMFLACGFNVGMQFYTFDESAKIVNDPNDPVANTAFNTQALDGGASFWWYSPDFFVGINSNVLASRKLPWLNDNKVDALHQAAAGVRIPFADNKFGLIPSILVRKAGTLLQYDASLTLRMLDNFWIGGIYRGKQGIAALVGGSYKSFNLTYSYDYFNRSGFSGFHEFTLGLRFPHQTSRYTEPYRYKPLKALRIPTTY